MKDENSFPFMYKFRALHALTSSKKISIEIDDEVKIKNLFIMVKKKELKRTVVEKIDTEKLSDMLVYNNVIDLKYGYMPFITGIKNLDFNMLIKSYLYINPYSKIGKHENNLKDLCKIYFENVPKSLLKIPDGLNKQIYRDLIRVIQEDKT